MTDAYDITNRQSSETYCSKKKQGVKVKTIGLIGGMSWESTIPYYRTINQQIKQQLGGLHSAKIVLVSVDFHEIEQFQRQGDWDAAGRAMADAAKRLQLAGADFIVLCTNTMHKVPHYIEDAVAIPLLHIADRTAIAIKKAGLHKVGLLGTQFTMEQNFYRERLIDQYGLDVVIPEPEERAMIHRVIYDELCLGITSASSRHAYQQVIEHLQQKGAQAIILGCTEIGLLISQTDACLPLFDTTALHAKAAADMALAL